MIQYTFNNTICYRVAKVLGLKKSCAKGDKKKKKEVTEEIARLEAELDKRHEEELQKIKAQQPTEVSVTSRFIKPI